MSLYVNFMPWEMYDGEEDTVQQPSGCIMDAILEDHEWLAKTYLKKKKLGVETVPVPPPRITELMIQASWLLRSPVFYPVA